MVALIRPDSPELWVAAGRLVDEYVSSLNVTLDFQDFTHERAHLAEEYGPPSGAFLLAADCGAFVGCGAFRRFAETTCEMKRLYVTPGWRGCGVGRMVAEALIMEARHRGYARMVLDTLPSMMGAQALYRSLGFRPVDAYRFNPIPGAAYFSLNLET